MERKTAILAKEFRRYDIDIVALSETHLLDEGKLEEVGTGYTFFWKGRPSNATRQSGVGFAVTSSLVGSLDNLPRGINDRLNWAKYSMRRPGLVTRGVWRVRMNQSEVHILTNNLRVTRTALHAIFALEIVRCL